MHFVSSRDRAQRVSLAAAMQRALAPDGGLYIAERLPRLAERAFDGCGSLADVAARLLAPFFADSELQGSLAQLCAEALDVPAPLRPCGETHAAPRVLELYHGPTAAFKDFGARFLAGCLARLPRRRTILVATSGDTGSAVAAAFHGRADTRVVVLYPAGGVSPRQAQQLGCWGDNVAAYAVQGTFDDCQALAKAAFADAQLSERHALASANSINLGRLLPQMSYYAAASLSVQRDTGRAASFIVPTGNLGNALACLWARTLGMPIDRVVLATNANRTIPDYLASGDWRPRPSVATLASAMDVGDPSNMERLRALAGEAIERVRGEVSAVAVDDAAIRAEIGRTWRKAGRIVCPHTATAMHAYRTLHAQTRAGREWIVVATAHPAKFDAIVEPIVGREVDVPPALAALLARPASARPLRPRLDALAAALDRGL